MSTVAYIGSFSYQGSEGITVCEYHDENGRVSVRKTIYPEINAGSLTVNRGILYATDEQGNSGKDGGGRIFTFRLDRRTGNPELVNITDTYALNPSHVMIDQTGKYMVVTHFSIGAPVVQVEREKDGAYHSSKKYNDTITSLYRLDENGIPGKLCDVFYHKQAGKQSFIHKAFFGPAKNLYAYCDLGADILGFFRIDYENEKLEMTEKIICEEQAGPRHGVFHKTLPYVYVNYERKGAITRFAYGENGYRALDEISVVPENMVMTPECNQSEILLNPEGTRMYNLMRGLGLVNVLDVSCEDGKLSPLQTLKIGSKVPRGASLTPDGKFLLIACNDTERILTLHVLENGCLKAGELSERMPHPASIAFYRTEC